MPTRIKLSPEVHDAVFNWRFSYAVKKINQFPYMGTETQRDAILALAVTFGDSTSFTGTISSVVKALVRYILSENEAQEHDHAEEPLDTLDFLTTEEHMVIWENLRRARLYFKGKNSPQQDMNWDDLLHEMEVGRGLAFGTKSQMDAFFTVQRKVQKEFARKKEEVVPNA